MRGTRSLLGVGMSVGRVLTPYHWHLVAATTRTIAYWNAFLLPPANEVCEGYVFTCVCHSIHGGGVHGRGDVCGGGGHVWQRDGGMCGRDCAWQGGVARTLPPPRTYYEIRPMSGRYAFYVNAFFLIFLASVWGKWRCVDRSGVVLVFFPFLYFQ